MAGVLVAAFEPFGGDTINASWEAVRLLGLGDERIETLCLPCAFRRSEGALREAIARLSPDVLLLVGQAADRDSVCIERIAVNLDDARLPDNDGERRLDRSIEALGPAAYFGGLEARRLVERLSAEGIPARTSLSAGAYVCNHAFYAASHAVAASGSATRVGLVHIPISPAQAERHPHAPTMATETVVRALALIVDEVLRPGPGAAMAAIASPEPGR